MKDCDWIKVGYAHCRFITKLKTRCNNLLLNTLHSVPSHHPVRKPIQTIYSLNICSHQLTTPPTHLPFPPFTHQVVRKNKTCAIHYKVHNGFKVRHNFIHFWRIRTSTKKDLFVRDAMMGAE